MEWRIRIACCLGLRDLLKRPNGLRLRYNDRHIVTNEAGTSKNLDSKMEVDHDDSTEPDLHRLWMQLFRVMDDVHDGTRKAAEGTAKVVSKVSNCLSACPSVFPCLFEMLFCICWNE